MTFSSTTPPPGTPPTGVVVVGASTPIGRAITARFVADGASVVGASLEPADDPQLTAHLVADAATTAGAEELVTVARDRLGRVDTVVVATAMQRSSPVHLMTDEHWRASYAGAVDVLFNVARAVVPHLYHGSAIVAVSTVNATRPAPWISGYASAKAAMEGLVRALAVDYAASGIRCNAVAPGVVFREDGEAPVEYPLRRRTRPADVAEAVHFLGTARSAAITGVTLPVDGGLGVASPSTAVRPQLAERAADRPDPAASDVPDTRT
ncbi:SDR family NAD(P)-dependent oxidoreductase [Propionibacteriaceae bacterium Y2011]|uniref:SDR family NAD(P)-dependent oxidoreductase n=1 Tax=Microlunatus sp. Y2014 TaxID=3418488 RepID=UPI003B4F0809